MTLFLYKYYDIHKQKMHFIFITKWSKINWSFDFY